MQPDVVGVPYWQVSLSIYLQANLMHRPPCPRHQKFERKFHVLIVSIVLTCIIFSPPYNALKVDVWSLGATVWEMAEAEPPFASSQQLSDRWPPLSKPKLFSPAFHDFLRQCSEPASSRPSPAILCSVCIHALPPLEIMLILLQ